MVHNLKNQPDECGRGYWSNGYLPDTLEDIVLIIYDRYRLQDNFSELSEVLKENNLIKLAQLYKS
jgi:hypothetical protein